MYIPHFFSQFICKWKIGLIPRLLFWFFCLFFHWLTLSVSIYFLNLYFILEYSWLTMLCQFHVYSKVIQLYIYMYLFFFKYFSQFFFHFNTEYWAVFPVLYSRSLLVIYFKYSSVYMSISNSQSIPPPHPSPLVTISSWNSFL